MQKKQVLKNAFMSVIQIIVIAIVLFILYKFLLNTIGVEQFGIWSLVLATTSTAQIAQFGLTGSVVKFVAKYIARKDYQRVSDIIQTASLSISMIMGFILVAGYPLIKWILSLIVPQKYLLLAFSILPYAFIALWFMTIVSIFQSGLDGYQRIDLRSSLIMFGAVVNLILCFFLAPLFGLMGVAYARVFSNSLLVLISWILLKKQFPMLPIIPNKWKKGVFKEIMLYGLNFQVISIARIFYDPITKALLSKFGGLSMVGYYEMASKMVQQFRALIVSANQVLVPAIADLKEKAPEKIKKVYLTCYKLLVYLALPMYSMIIISAPLISRLWIGHYENVFIIFSIVLSIGWLFNTLVGPAYFAYLGIGQLCWNVVSHITIALLNIGVGFLLGCFFGGIGVVTAFAISLTAGSSIIYISYHLLYKIPISEFFPKASRIVFLACSIGVLLGFLIKQRLNHIVNVNVLNGIIIFLFLIIILAPLWLHPMRKQLMGWINNELLNRKAEL